jgi:hypothetical protein
VLAARRIQHVKSCFGFFRTSRHVSYVQWDLVLELDEDDAVDEAFSVDEVDVDFSARSALRFSLCVMV